MEALFVIIIIFYLNFLLSQLKKKYFPFKDIFSCEPFLSLYLFIYLSPYLICYNIASVLRFGFLASRHVGPTRDQTHIPCIGRQSLNH